MFVLLVLKVNHREGYQSALRRACTPGANAAGETLGGGQIRAFGTAMSLADNSLSSLKHLEAVSCFDMKQFPPTESR